MINYFLKLPTDTILIRGARQLLTLRGSAGPRRLSELQQLHMIPDGSLLIEGGVIREVGPTRRVENLAAARDAFEINAAGKIVMPGFLDSHTHLAFPPAGAEGDPERALRMIHGFTGRLLRAQNRACLAAMARHGATGVEVKTGCGPEDSAEAKLLRVLASLNGDPIDVYPTFLLRLPEKNSRAAVEWALCDLLPKMKRRRFTRCVDLLWDHERPNPELYARYFAGARQLGFACKLHVDGHSPDAISFAVEHQVMNLGYSGPITEDGAQLLARSRIVATLTPDAAIPGERGTAARTLIDRGAAIALATDFNPNQAGTLSMQTVVSLAHMCWGLSVEEAITAVTINAAHALGCANSAGSLEPGKSADLLLLDVPDYRELGRRLGANMIHMVLKRGQTIYEQGKVSAPARTQRSDSSVVQ